MKTVQIMANELSMNKHLDGTWQESEVWIRNTMVRSFA